jgi:RHS repeat-associated protein
VGLTTTFSYTGNHVTSITDPAGRVTKLEYDAQGNLISIIDPDNAKNQYGYDSRHLQTLSIDRIGNKRTGTYDEFGRAKTAQREDGTIVQINPIAVQGLHNQQETTNLADLPTAQFSNNKLVSTYVDANGNTSTRQLNTKGHVLSITDSVGTVTTNTEDNAGNITSVKDVNGNITLYSYDQKGNLLSVVDYPPININELSNAKTPTSIATSTPGIPNALAIGDINNDGYVDIISTADYGKLSVLFGDDQGSFANKSIIDISPFTQSNIINQLELKDVNNDGKLDLIANLPIDGSTGGGNGNNSSLLFDPVLVFINQGGGQFASAKVLTLVAKSDGFVTGDFNGDGKLDILVRSDIYSSQTSNVYPLVLFVGDGAGNFIEQQIRISGINTNSNFMLGLQTAAIDVNGDGKTELVFNLHDRLSIYGYDNTGVWSEIYQDISDFTTQRSKFTVGDINKDGKLDIITAGSGSTELLLGQGNGSFQSKVSTRPNFSYDNISEMKVVDVNSDQQQDLIIIRDSGNQSSVETYNLNNNQQLVKLEEPAQIQSVSYNGYRGMADIDGNGNLDLLWALPSSSAIGVTKDYFKFTSHISSYSITQPITLINGTSTIATKSYAYDSQFNQLTQFTDELGRTTVYNRDPNNGHILTSTRIVGKLDTTSNENDDVVTSYTYTSTGQVDTVTDALQHITDYDYDNFGHTIKITTAKNTSDQAVEQYEYDLAGNRTAVIDPLGRRTTFTYDKMNMLLQTINSLGGVTTFTYDKMGHQTSVTDSLGHTTKLTYDVRGRLLSTTDANGSVTSDTYDNNGNLLSVKNALDKTVNFVYDARNRLVSSTDTEIGGTKRYTYDLNNNLIAIIDSLGNKTQRFYDNRNRLIREVDALGNEIKYAYDAANELTQIIDAKGSIASYYYDQLGRQTAEFKASSQTVGVKTIYTYGYNNYGYYGVIPVNLPCIYADGYTNRFEYDKLGNVTASIDPNNNRTEYKYDVLNRRIEVKDAQGNITKTAYDKVGNVISATDALNHSINFEYDALDRLIHITDALGNISTRAFDRVGNLLGVTDALGHTTTYGYDNLNRQISTTDALGQTKLVAYDAVDNLINLTNELGQVTGFTYDALNRLTRITDALGHTQTMVYDSESNVRSITDGLGNKTSYDYDALNRQVKVTDAKGGITSTSYDAVGNLAKITDSIGNSTTYSYDRLDRLITDTNQLGFSLHYTYDGVGNEVEKVDRNGRKTTYGYDNLNRNTSENWIGAAGQNLRSIGYTYDAAGRLVTESDPDSKYTFGYDAVDRLTSVDNTGTTGVPAVVFTYAYDGVSNLVSVFDQINGVSTGQASYVYDLLNRATRITQSGTGVQNKRVDMTYNKVNQMTGLTRFSDVGGVNLVAETSYTYDQNQKLVQLAHKKGATNLASYDYTYDSANRLTKVVSSVDGATDYSYDSTNQLTGADHSNQVDEAYQYDANGNRINSGYQTGTNNQLLADGQFTYQYDQEGNRTKRTEILTGKVTEYVWDYRNRLAQVLFKDAGGGVLKSIEYIYDINNQRIGKKIDGVVTERYVIDRNQIALVFDGQGTQKQRYLYGMKVDQVLAEEAGASLRWFLADEQGTIKDVVDNTGIVIDHITYDSFGRIVGQTSSIDLRFAYTGREWDAETGQYYYRARYYDPTVGRFINEDPLGFGAGDTNIYRYVGNSPTNYIDPSGEESTDPLDRLDQFVAGFGDKVSFGGTTKIREALYGDFATRNHQGGYYQAGQVTGEVASNLVGGAPLKGAKAATDAARLYNNVNNAYQKAQNIKDKFDAGLNIVQGCGDLNDVAQFIPQPNFPGRSNNPQISNINSRGHSDSLLPNEGNVGRYKDLKKAGTKGDNITPHHVPSDAHMKQHGVSTNDGIAMNMEQYKDNTGRHPDTFTYGNGNKYGRGDVNMSPRDALAAGVNDLRGIYQRDGLYNSGIRGQLQELIQQNKAANPSLFQKN